MIRLNKRQILSLHSQQISLFGGSDGVRDDNLLDLSISSASQTFDGSYLYDNPIKQAVNLGFSLIMNHPFLDGNKRIGAHAMLTILCLNGFEIDYSQDELIDVIMGIASSSLTENDLLEWVENHM
ncbi:type II toxin-antitoxin system death-on-curing family toxin [Anaerococcus cruorum]|uniref:Type II toxin-antitoxin system death-on-curing family toxin n=1 Tax=Anaerococcus cruorum TaxID=3115617 RepID=A0ABW9MUS5_9FIRM